MSNLNDISSNSDSARDMEEEVRDQDYTPIEKVSVIGRLLGVFGIESDFGGAVGSVWEDVIKPTFLDGCRDSMYALADYFFGGGGGSSSRKRSGNKKGHTDYSGRFKGGRSSKGKSPNQALYYITWEDRTEALDKLDQMWDVIRQCDFCSVQDYLTICKKKTDNYTLGDWGWYSNDLNGVRPVRNGEGEFYLNLPKPKAKDD